MAVLFLNVGASIATSFSPNYLVYTALRAVGGLTFPAIFQIPFVMCEMRMPCDGEWHALTFRVVAALEFMGPRHRTLFGMILMAAFSVALMLLSGLAYVFNDWYHLSLVTSVPFLGLLR